MLLPMQDREGGREGRQSASRPELLGEPLHDQHGGSEVVSSLPDIVARPPIRACRQARVGGPKARRSPDPRLCARSPPIKGRAWALIQRSCRCHASRHLRPTLVEVWRGRRPVFSPSSAVLRRIARSAVRALHPFAHTQGGSSVGLRILGVATLSCIRPGREDDQRERQTLDADRFIARSSAAGR